MAHDNPMVTPESVQELRAMLTPTTPEESAACEGLLAKLERDGELSFGEAYYLGRFMRLSPEEQAETDRIVALTIDQLRAIWESK